MKKYVILSVIMLLTLSACEDYKERYYFTENRIEFEDAVININTSGFGYPVLPDVNGDEGGIVRFRVNMTGEQKPYDRILEFDIQELSTAREGIEYNLVHGNTYVIPANSSFGFIEVEVLPGGTGRRVLGFELKETDDIKVMQRYYRIGFRILYQSAPPDPDYTETINDITYFRRLTVGAQSSQEMGGWIDVVTGTVYTQLGTAGVENQIDLVYLRGTGTGANLITPFWGLSGWAAQNNFILEWAPEQRNHGTTIHWANPTPDEIALFENASSVDDLLEVFLDAQNTVRDRDGYIGNHGPRFRAQSIEDGDIVLFYSSQRKVVAMIRLLDWENTTTGLANFAVKSGQIPDNIAKRVLTLAPQSSTVVGGAADLLGGGVYFRDPCTSSGCHPKGEPVHEQIDIGTVYFSATSTNPGVSLFSASQLHAAGSGNWSYIADVTSPFYWPTRNEAVMVRMPNATPAEIARFENAQSAADLQAIFDDAVADAPTRGYANANTASPTTYNSAIYGPHFKVSGIWLDDPVQLVAFRSTDRGIVSVIKITRVYVSNTSAIGNSNARVAAEAKTAQF